MASCPTTTCWRPAGSGAHRNVLSKRLLAEADVLLGLGTRFEEMETNWRPGYVPAPGARYIQVDLDGAEIGRSIPAHTPILGDVRTVLGQLLEIIRPRVAGGPLAADPRVLEVIEGVAEIDAVTDKALADDRVPLSPLRVIREARLAFPRETTVAVDVGCLAEHIAGAFPFFRVYEPRSFIAPSSFYGMGFATSAARSRSRVPGPARAVLLRRRLVPDGAAGAAGRRGEPPSGDLVRT